MTDLLTWLQWYTAHVRSGGAWSPGATGYPSQEPQAILPRSHRLSFPGATGYPSQEPQAILPRSHRLSFPGATGYPSQEPQVILPRSHRLSFPGATGYPSQEPQVILPRSHRLSWSYWYIHMSFYHSGQSKPRGPSWVRYDSSFRCQVTISD